VEILCWCLAAGAHPTHMCLDEALTAARRIGAARIFYAPDHAMIMTRQQNSTGVELAYDSLKVSALRT